MLRNPKSRLALWASLLSALSVVQGCGGVGATPKGDSISVVSDPAGASVFTMGERLGTTPLVLGQHEVFPLVYRAEHEKEYGVLVLKKEGCMDHTLHVGTAAVSKGLEVKLDCGRPAAERPRTEAGKGTPPAAGTPGLRPSADTTARAAPKKRLQQIDELRKDNLITEQEYRAIRKRILDDL